MRRFLTAILAICLMMTVTACGKEPSNANPGSGATPIPAETEAPTPSPTPQSTGDAETDTAMAVGKALYGSFDSVMDRGKFTLNDVACRLFYLVKDSRAVANVCIAPDGTVYYRQGTGDWQKVTASGGTYSLPSADRGESTHTSDASGSASSGDASGSGSASDGNSSSGEGSTASDYTPPPVETYVSGSYAWPTTGYGLISFGYDEPHSDGRRHAGIDIAGSDIAGTAVCAVDAGTVSYIGDDPEGYGIYVCISHSNGEFAMSLYAQLADVTVSEGDSVSAGETIGHVGNTGSADGYHLHLGIYATEDTSAPLNPMSLFPGLDVTYLDD